MKKLSNLWSKMSTKAKGVVVSGGVGASLLASSMAAFAAEDTEAVSAAKSLMNNITATLNISNAVAILGAGIGAVVGLFLAWWGARKLGNMVVNVFRKGKIKF